VQWNLTSHWNLRFQFSPRIYRLKFQRDIYKDLAQLEKAVSSNDECESSLDMFSLEMFENIAYIMAKHADNNIPDNPEDWLDEFSTFSIYQVLPELIKLRGLNVQTLVESKKTSTERTEMTTPLFLLRCLQVGLSIRELDLLTVGMVNDIFIENMNDDCEYATIGGQEEMDAF
jgi:hypothetical protein